MQDLKGLLSKSRWPLPSLGNSPSSNDPLTELLNEPDDREEERDDDGANHNSQDWVGSVDTRRSTWWPPIVIFIRAILRYLLFRDIKRRYHLESRRYREGQLHWRRCQLIEGAGQYGSGF